LRGEIAAPRCTDLNVFPPVVVSSLIGSGSRRGRGLGGRVSAEDAGECELASCVSHHLLGDEHADEGLAVVDGKVWPTKSGMIVELRLHVFSGSRLFWDFCARTRFHKRLSTCGSFFIDLDIVCSASLTWCGA